MDLSSVSPILGLTSFTQTTNDLKKTKDTETKKRQLPAVTASAEPTKKLQTGASISLEDMETGAASLLLSLKETPTPDSILKPIHSANTSLVTKLDPSTQTTAPKIIQTASVITELVPTTHTAAKLPLQAPAVNTTTASVVTRTPLSAHLSTQISLTNTKITNKVAEKTLLESLRAAIRTRNHSLFNQVIGLYSQHQYNLMENEECRCLIEQTLEFLHFHTVVVVAPGFNEKILMNSSILRYYFPNCKIENNCFIFPVSGVNNFSIIKKIMYSLYGKKVQLDFDYDIISSIFLLYALPPSIFPKSSDGHPYRPTDNIGLFTGTSNLKLVIDYGIKYYHNTICDDIFQKSFSVRRLTPYEFRVIIKEFLKAILEKKDLKLLNSLLGIKDKKIQSLIRLNLDRRLLQPFWNQSEFCDLTFKIESTKLQFNVNSFIFKLFSPIARAGVIRVPASKNVDILMQWIIKYCYGYEIPNPPSPSVELNYDFLVLANFLQISDLQTTCEENLESSIHLENYQSILAKATDRSQIAGIVIHSLINKILQTHYFPVNSNLWISNDNICEPIKKTLKDHGKKIVFFKLKKNFANESLRPLLYFLIENCPNIQSLDLSESRTLKEEDLRTLAFFNLKKVALGPILSEKIHENQSLLQEIFDRNQSIHFLHLSFSFAQIDNQHESFIQFLAKHSHIQSVSITFSVPFIYSIEVSTIDDFINIFSINKKDLIIKIKTPNETNTYSNIDYENKNIFF